MGKPNQHVKNLAVSALNEESEDIKEVSEDTEKTSKKCQRSLKVTRQVTILNSLKLVPQNKTFRLSKQIKNNSLARLYF